ncbi:hypothetical protein AWW72_18890 [Acinetobacter sp. NRRL B-65365]|uniref:hypothetical protein n=1 Tax=Acinetobacter sp. NRRL B-65365 TaxID=1785092 RepID=UPI0007A0440E|nr:hypothetical protein [Acinetobacter sp. NRRL B-65365]KYQ80315.1 hypothetical protein AWW72_18890 [Acinetobacter sp. NRRL B-65365]
MPQYLRLADNLYNVFEQKQLFTYDSQELVNLIFRELRKALKDTDLKLLVNFIDMEKGLIKSQEGDSGFDLSLIPNYKNKGEFILWLAVFIEKMTEGGVKKLPPLYKNIPEDFTFTFKEKQTLRQVTEQKIFPDIEINPAHEEIMAYFESVDFKKNSGSI